MKKIKKIIKNILALFFIIIGVLSGFLPVLQGWVFVMLGYLLLDFKKKELFEKKIILFLSKIKFTKKLAKFWLYAKRANKKLLTEKSNKNIKQLYEQINKEIKIN